MEDHRSSSPTTIRDNHASPSATPEIKSQSNTARALYSSKLSSDQKSRSPGSAGDYHSKSSSTPSQANKQPAAAQKAWNGRNSPKNTAVSRSPTTQTASSSPNKPPATASLQEGQTVSFTLRTGAEFEGIYASNPDDESSCFLNLVQQKKGPNFTSLPNGATNMSFQRKDIANARVSSNNSAKNDGRATNGSRAGFRTDAAISNSRGPMGRELQRWEPDAPSSDANLSLEKSTGGTWDQFSANEKLFGLKTDYDENMYTTAIDKEHPEYKQRMAIADKAARAIMNSAPATSHVAEERQMDFVGGADEKNEEDKYSGVRRQAQADFPPLGSRENRENKYTPPARRAPTSHSTVKGAPVDPAIISAQLKAPTPKQQTSKAEENKVPAAQAKTSSTTPTPTPEVKVAEAKQDVKSEKKAKDSIPAAAKPEAENKGTAAPSLRPSGATSRTVSPQTTQPNKPPADANSAASTVEKDVLASFKTFASKERSIHEKARSHKAKADKEVKLTELKKFGESFKLSTPVPKDLIPIIAKDPAKQKAIQDKALQDAEALRKENAAKEAAAATAKPKATAAATKETQAKVPTVPTTSTGPTPPPAADTRAATRPSAPQHSSSPSAVPGRQPGGRQQYAPQHNYQQSYRNNRQNGQFGGQQAPQPQGGLGQRIRDAKQMHQHQPQQHMPVDNIRYPPPTGPANGFDPQFGRRGSGNYQGQYQQAKTLRPNAVPFAPSFTGPSQASSPRSAVNTMISEPPRVAVPPVRGQLVRRKTKAVDVNKCNVLRHLMTIKPPANVDWSDNLGLCPAFRTLPGWRTARDDVEENDPNIRMKYKDWFAKQQQTQTPAVSAAPTQQPTPSVLPHQHQLPFHLQGNNHGMGPRPSPHMAPIPMHNGQPGPMVHAPPFSQNDDHRMMQSNSAQSFSPRMQQPMVAPYGQNMNAPMPVFMTPGQQMPPGPFINNAAPPMNPGYRSFSNNSQYMGQQQHMGAPMMAQHPYAQPTPVMQPAQMGMYPNHAGAHFMPAPGVGGPPSVAGSNGFPSPGRPQAPMMVPQGSQQGQAMPYGMSPSMYQPQLYQPQQPPKNYQGQRP